MFYIVDGSGLVFRAFFAILNLVNLHNQPCNAVFGFCRMLLNLINQSNNMVIVFDGKDENFRKQIDEKYKSNRPPMDERLVSQWPEIFKVCQIFGVPHIIAKNYEADDLIATLANYNKQFTKITIITSDKDLLQLYEKDRVFIFDPMKNIHRDETHIYEKFGVDASKVCYVQALMGDSSDGVAGVYGIGPKKASALINQFGNVENLLNNSHKIVNKKIRESIEISRANIKTALELVTLRLDAPQVLGKSFLEYRFDCVNWQKIRLYFEDQGFKKLLLELKKIENAKLGRDKNMEGESLLKNMGFTLDGVFYEFAKDFKKVFLIQDLGALQLHFLENDTLYIFDGQNLLVLENINWETLRVELKNYGVFNIIILDYAMTLFDKYVDFFSVDNLAPMMHLAYNFVYEGKIEDLWAFLQCKMEQNNLPNSLQCLWTLYNVLLQDLNRKDLLNLYYRVEKPLASLLVVMHRTGIAVNMLRLQDFYKNYTAQLNQLENHIFELLGKKFNLASPKQILQQLKMENCPKLKALKSTNAKDLEPFCHIVWIKKFLDWRRIYKLLHTYVEGIFKWIVLPDKTQELWQRNDWGNLLGTIYPFFSSFNTLTGRLVSFNPNMQNLPLGLEEGGGVRSVFVVDEDRYSFVSFDYSQIELRVLAHFAKVKALLLAFKNNLDVHLVTAKDIFNAGKDFENDKQRVLFRNRAKAINFGIIYGMKAKSLAEQIKVLVPEAQQYMDRYFARYPEIFDHMERAAHMAQSCGYVTTLLGRRCFVNKQDDSAIKRQAINASIQGSAADIVKLAMLKITEQGWYKKYDVKLILQIHDELVFKIKKIYVPDLIVKIKNIMEKIVELEVNLVVNCKMGNSLGDLKDV